MIRLCYLLSFLCLHCPTLFADNWTDNSGKYTVEAEFVSLQSGIVKLKRTDGRVIDFQLTKLNAQGQDRVKQLATRNASSPKKLMPEKDKPKDSSDELAAKFKTNGNASIHRGVITSRDGTKTPFVHLVVKVDFLGDAAQNATEFGFLTIDSAMANGMPVKRKESPKGFDISGRFRKIGSFDYKRLDDGCRLPIEFIASEKTAGPVSVSGSLKFKTGGKNATVTISDPASLSGAVQNPKLKAMGAAVEVNVKKGRSVHNLYILVQKEFKDGSIESIELIDGAGKDIRVATLGSVTRGRIRMRQYHVEFRAPPPSNLQLRLLMRANLKEIKVPFQFDGLPISE